MLRKNFFDPPCGICSYSMLEYPAASPMRLARQVLDPFEPRRAVLLKADADDELTLDRDVLAYTVPFRSIRHVTGHRGPCRSKFPVVSQVTKSAVGGVKRAPIFRRADARPNRSKVAVGHTVRPAPSNLSISRTMSPVTGPVELIEMVQYQHISPPWLSLPTFLAHHTHRRAPPHLLSRLPYALPSRWPR